MSELPRNQYQKLMKRPSMSELDGVVFRSNQRREKVLEHEVNRMDKVAKIQLNEHHKRRKSFVDSQVNKLASQSRGRRSLDSSDSVNTDSFQKLSVLNPQSRRGSLPVSMPWHPFAHRDQGSAHKRRSSMQHLRASAWDQLSASKWTNRSLAIRKKLYDEFNVTKKSATRRRPWSPADGEVPAEQPIRRSSEPIVKLTDNLSPEMEARLARILGYNVKPADQDGAQETNSDDTKHAHQDHTNVITDTDTKRADTDDEGLKDKPTIMDVIKGSRSRRRYSDVHRPSLLNRPNRRHSESTFMVKLPAIEDGKQLKQGRRLSAASVLPEIG